MAAKKLPPVPVVALAGWLVPGLGYWLIGQRCRALVSGITIIVLFLGGIFLGGIRVVDVPIVEVSLTNQNQRDWKVLADPMGQILTKPWFIAQIFSGPLCLGAAYESLWVASDPVEPIPASTSRIFDIGTLYTAVAGMLNLLVLIDAAYRTARTNARPAWEGSAA